MNKPSSTTRDRPASAFAVAACLLLLLTTAYVAAYCVTRDPFGCSERTGDGSVVVFYFPRYSMGGHWAATLFWPLEKLDQRFRPEAWRKKITGPTN